MTPRIKRILKFLKKALGLVFLLIVVYVLIVVAEVLWAFQVKLKRWPVYVFGSPYAVQVGDDINKIRLLERLSRLGYVQSPVLVPEPGQWSRSISSLDVNLKHCPVSGLGIVSGPVSITLDWERIRTIHLTRSLEDIERIVLEPELIHIVPAAGWGSILCRPVTLDHVPRLLVDAILLTEDTHFFSHSGIDVESIFKALLANFRAWRYAQGASTITQQLIRMTLLTPKKTLPRKVHEVALSLTAELMYSKEAILEAYLNRVYFGHWGQYSVHGVQEASSYLFGKALRQLDPAECSLIAATIMAPNIITPRRHLERARSRRNMVLGLLFKEGKITRDEYEQGLASELTIQPPGAGPVKAPAFVDLVEDAISRDFQGLGAEHRDVITSLDPVLQNLVNHELRLLGQAGAQTHLILTILKSGWLRAFVEPGTPKWEGKGGNLNVMLPLVMIPALIPEKDGQARFTLTSQFLGPGQSARPVTLREAFTKDRDLLIRRLTETIGVEPVIAVLKEFDVQARPDGQGGVSVEPITPMKMAQIYSLLARLGSVAIISPGIRSPEGAEA
ncbi:MAG: transglycosylase domain-containing protein, partial [Deltaproteobacteria bacterium]|nr:transglycosylase domain-containing protein [Deltaproteobacteria bacterium]